MGDYQVLKIDINGIDFYMVDDDMICFPLDSVIYNDARSRKPHINRTSHSFNQTKTLSSTHQYYS